MNYIAQPLWFFTTSFHRLTCKMELVLSYKWYPCLFGVFFFTCTNKSIYYIYLYSISSFFLAGKGVLVVLFFKDNRVNGHCKYMHTANMCDIKSSS